MTDNAFGKTLRAMRCLQGDTLEDLAYCADCSIAYLSDIETGHRPPPSRALIHKLSHALGCSELKLLMLAARTRGTITVKTEDMSNKDLERLIGLS